MNEHYIQSEVKLPDGYVLRSLTSDDYNKGFMELLGQLSSVGDISYAQFISRYNAMVKSHPLLYHVFVIEDFNASRIVATACLVLEYHFIHQCGTRGRIEDVVVDKNVRGRSFGLILTRHLVDMAKTLGVYKCSLECVDELIPFYKRAGFYQDKNKFLVQRFDL